MISILIAAAAFSGVHQFAPDAGNPDYIEGMRELHEVSVQGWKACLREEALSYSEGSAAADIIFEAAVGKCADWEKKVIVYFNLYADAKKIKFSSTELSELRIKMRDRVRPQIIAAILDERK